MHLDEDLEVIAWQVGDLVHREGQLHLEAQQGFISCYDNICSVLSLAPCVQTALDALYVKIHD